MAGEPQHAMAVTRAADRDRYLSVLYAPEEKRGALFALYAFNSEIAGIRDRVSEPLPGAVRLQFWRDALAMGVSHGGGEAEGAPLVIALTQTIREHGLPLDPFLNMLDAREFDLYDDPMPSRNDLEGYCGETASALIQLASLVLDPAAARGVAEIAGHAGCAQAIAGLLRLLPIHRRRGQCYVPADVMAAAGIDREAFLSGRDGSGAERVIAAMMALGHDHAARFETLARDLAPALRPAFLPAGLAPAYFGRLEGKGVRALDEVAEIPAWRRHWIMFRRATSGWG